MIIKEMEYNKDLSKSYDSTSNLRGKSRCKTLREHNLNLTTPTNIHFDAAVAELDVIRLFLNGELDIDEVSTDLLSQGVDDKWKVMDAVRDLRRYLSSIQRLSEKPILLDTKYFVVNGHKIKVSPLLAFVRSNEVEVVIVRTGKPTVAQSGNKRDGSVSSCLELWMAGVYGRTLVKRGEKKTVLASYHFLRKNTDRGGYSANYDADFFDGKGGGNIVTLNAGVCDGGELENDKVDDNYLKQLEQFYEGCDREKMTEADCSHCPNFVACNYQPTPVPHEKISIDGKKKEIKWSESQEDIINFDTGAARVIAKAGSGKTTCITERAARLIAGGVKPLNLLMLTYTEAAAQEMKDRTIAAAEMKKVAVSADDLWCSTFHAFGYRIICDNYKALGYDKIPKIIDTNDVAKKRYINDALEQVDFFTYANHNDALGWAVRLFDVIKSCRVNVNSATATDDLMRNLDDFSASRLISYQEYTKIISAYKIYDATLKQNCYITYADVEQMMNIVMSDYPEYVESLGYEHIIIDEMQDSNEIQLETISHLINTKCYKSLMVVGDSNQSIYAFRHTSQEIILNLWELLGIKGTDFTLLENRRSIESILKFADDYIELNESNDGNRMIATREKGFSPIVRGFCDSKDQIKFVVDQIIAAHNKGVPYENIAIEAFKRSELIKFAAKLSEAGIPWINRYPLALCENSRVQAACSLAMAFYQPEAESLFFDYLICLNDGDIFKDMTNAQIRDQLEELKEEWSQMDYKEIPLQRKLFHDRLEALRGTDELYESFLKILYENEDLQSELEFIRDFKKFGDGIAVKLNGEYNGVTLITSHSSKGLEWPVVFVSVDGFDNEFLHGRGHKEEVEERRRLLYVAMTRARDYLYTVGTYKAYGKKGEYTYNQFLAELYKVAGREYDPVGAEQMYYAEREAEKKAKDPNYTPKSTPAKRKKNAKVSADEMTPEQIAEYENLIKGAQQISFA